MASVEILRQGVEVEINQIQLAMSVGSLAVAGVMAHVMQSAKSEVLKLRVEIAEGRIQEMQARQKERDELRAWLNGSFLRASVVEARFTEFNYRLSRIEEREQCNAQN